MGQVHSPPLTAQGQGTASAPPFPNRRALTPPRMIMGGIQAQLQCSTLKTAVHRIRSAHVVEKIWPGSSIERGTERPWRPAGDDFPPTMLWLLVHCSLPPANDCRAM